MTLDTHESNEGPLSMDICLELLADDQRRKILKFLIEQESNPISIDEIISVLVEDDVAVEEQPKKIEAALYHVHLPRFANAGILEYDPRHLEINYFGDNRIEKLLSKIEEVQ